MRVLFIGDIVGKGGRRAVRELTPVLREQHDVSFCIANGENMAGGGGMTRRCVEGLRDSGVDVITGGDHMWDQPSWSGDIALYSHVLRPANLSPSQPGRGYGVFPLPDGGEIAVMCLLGRTFMNSLAQCPFQAAEAVLEEVSSRTPNVFVDFHAEATSETVAMGRHLDGRVTAVIGTHTHIPTADECVLPGGTAFQCDAGMVGSRESILGRAIEPVLHRFTTGMPARFKVVERAIRLQGTVVDVDPSTGRSLGITRVTADLEE